MKKLFCTTAFAIILLSGVIFVGCQKEQTVNSAVSTSQIDTSINALQSDRKAATYNAQSLMKTTIFGLLPATTDENFRNTVHQEIEKKFDGDDNVLLKDLNTIIPIEQMMNDNLQKELIVTNDITDVPIQMRDNEDDDLAPEVFKNKEKIRTAVNGFYFLKDNYYLQVYIPFYEQVNLKQTPTLILGAHKKVSKATKKGTDEDMEAYQLQSNGKVKKMIVNEAYAKKNLVWVVSINERVRSDGKINQSDNTKEEPTVELRASQTELRISQVKIHDKKERFWQGDAEVAVLGWQETPACQRVALHDIGSFAFPDVKTTGVFTSPKDVSRNAIFSPFFQVPNALEPLNDVNLVMYEFDAGAARTIGYQNIQGTCNAASMTITSSDIEYGTWGITANYPFPTSVNQFNHTTTTPLEKTFTDPNTSALKITTRKVF